MAQDSKLRAQIRWPLLESRSNQKDKSKVQAGQEERKEIEPLDASLDLSAASASSSDEAKSTKDLNLQDRGPGEKTNGVVELQDGKTPETAIELDVNGKLFGKYILHFMRHYKVRFKDECDAHNTLDIAEDLGLDKLENYICNMLEIPTLKVRRAQEKNLADLESELGTFVSLPGGDFQMGSPPNEASRRPDEAQHKVTLSPFDIMDAAVTQLSYILVTGKNPSKHKERKYCPETFREIEMDGQMIPACPDHPVEAISWKDTQLFIEMMNQKYAESGYVFNLPTEAQFEYALRGGTQTAFVSGAEADMGNFAWYDANSTGPSGDKQTHPVKSKQANLFKIYNSSVYELTKDKYKEHTAAPAIDPQGPIEGTERVIKGNPFDSKVLNMRSAFRYKIDEINLYSNLGFRIIRTRK